MSLRAKGKFLLNQNSSGNSSHGNDMNGIPSLMIQPEEGVEEAEAEAESSAEKMRRHSKGRRRILSRRHQDNLKLFFSNITVEPVMFIVGLGLGLLPVVNVYLYVDKFCRVKID